MQHDGIGAPCAGALGELIEQDVLVERQRRLVEALLLNAQDDDDVGSVERSAIRDVRRTRRPPHSNSRGPTCRPHNVE